MRSILILLKPEFQQDLGMQFAVDCYGHGAGLQMKNCCYSQSLLSHSLLQSGAEGSVKTKKMMRKMRKKNRWEKRRTRM
jgi:hypothetical protein